MPIFVPNAFFSSTASGPPTSGTFATGDVVLDRAGATFWICTAGGTPGTWARIGGDRVIASAESDSTQTGITTEVDITGLILTDFVVTSAALVVLDCPYAFGSADGQVGVAAITDGSNAQKNGAVGTASGVSHFSILHCEERITVPGTYTRKGRARRSGGAGTIGIGAGVGLGYWQRLYVLGL